RVVGSACASSFSRLARRSLALRPAHSRCHQFVTRFPKASASSLPPWLLRLLPAGAMAGWDLHPLESAAFHGAHPELSLSQPPVIGEEAAAPNARSGPLRTPVVQPASARCLSGISGRGWPWRVQPVDRPGR